MMNVHYAATELYSNTDGGFAENQTLVNGLAAQEVVFELHHSIAAICACLLVLEILTGILGNTIVCYTVYKNKSLRTPMNALIINLCLADVFVSVISSPVLLYLVVNNSQVFVNEGQYQLLYLLCVLEHISYVFSGTVLLVTLVCISIERYHAIAKPFDKANRWLRIKISIAFSWLLGALTSLLGILFPVLDSDLEVTKVTTHQLLVERFHSGFIKYVFVPFSFVCVLLILTLYFSILVLIQKHVTTSNKKLHGKLSSKGLAAPDEASASNVSTIATGLQPLGPDFIMVNKVRNKGMNRGMNSNKVFPAELTNAPLVEEASTAVADGTQGQEHTKVRGNSAKTLTGTSPNEDNSMMKTIGLSAEEYHKNENGTSKSGQTGDENVHRDSQIINDNSKGKDDNRVQSMTQETVTVTIEDSTRSTEHIDDVNDIVRSPPSEPGHTVLLRKPSLQETGQEIVGDGQPTQVETIVSEMRQHNNDTTETSQVPLVTAKIADTDNKQMSETLQENVTNPGDTCQVPCQTIQKLDNAQTVTTPHANAKDPEAAEVTRVKLDNVQRDTQGPLIEVCDMDGKQVTVKTTRSDVVGNICVMNTANKERGKRKVEARTAKVTAVVIMAFLSCWLPFPSIVLSAVHMLPRDPDMTSLRKEALVLSLTIASLAAAINPLTYGIINRQIRNGIVRIIKKHVPKSCKSAK